MQSDLKQRLIGAAVLVALAVIFLPMLVKGPAPDSGVSDVSLNVPDAPQGEYRTVDLPLVVPEQAPEGGAVGMPAPGDDGATLPTVDTATAQDGQDARSEDAADLADDPAGNPAGNPGDASADPEPMLPATAAGGDYAVDFGAYASSVDADTVVSRLREARLPARREAASIDGRRAWRVRIGPYASRADAEIARIEAARVGRQPGARVVALDAATLARDSAGQRVVESSSATAEPAQPVADEPAEAATPVETPAPAAADTGFAVQIGAFSNAAQAGRQRDELRAAGFSAFTETVDTDQGVLTRVLAGPVLDRAAAEQLKAQIRAKLGSDGLVRSHP